MKTIEWTDVEIALNDVDFPASKQRLVGHAEQGGGSAEAVAALKTLPLAIYENMDEVRRSLPLDVV